MKCLLCKVKTLSVGGWTQDHTHMRNLHEPAISTESLVEQWFVEVKYLTFACTNSDHSKNFHVEVGSKDDM